MVIADRPDQENHSPDTRRRIRASHLEYVALGDMLLPPHAQREYDNSWADNIAADLHIEGMGFFAVSKRNGFYWLVDGQHRRAALLKFGFALEDKVQCEVYLNLTEKDEAVLFLDRNHKKSVSTMATFLVELNAEKEEALAIDRVVRAQDLHIGKRASCDGASTNYAISAVAALQRVNQACGLGVLAETLQVIRDAYGASGFESAIIESIAICLHRYGPKIDQAQFTASLASTPGGINGLIQPAERERLRTGFTRVQCIAASAANIYNRDQKTQSKKLSSWWKD